MSELTITLAGSEEKAEFSGGNAWLRNDGTDIIYAAKSAGISAGADGVVAIPAGQSAPVYGANGTVFLLGTGSVQLIGSDYSTNPFKTSAQSGGSGADSVARAAISAHAGNTDIHVTAAEKAAWNGKADKSDIPTKVGELDNDSGFITSPDGGNAAQLGGIPASELDRVRCAVVGGVKAGVQWTGVDATKGDTTIRMQVDADYDKMFLFKSTDGQETWTEIEINADTVDGKHASEMLQNLGYFNSGNLLNYALVEKTSGFVFVGNEVTGMPYDNTYWFVSIEHTANHCKITATDINNHRKTFNIVYNDTLSKWDEWINIADGGNADTLNGLHANEIASNPNLLINPDSRINQRGESSYSAVGYTVDRWQAARDVSSTTGDFTITPTADGLIIDNQTDGLIAIGQKVENFTELFGKTLTLSASVGGNAVSATGTAVNADGTILRADTDFGFISVYIKENTRLGAHIYVNSGATAVLDWIKLEIGEKATPFVPPDPATELAKCQRYYQIRTTNDIDPLDLRPSMRTITDIKQVTGGYAYVAEL